MAEAKRDNNYIPTQLAVSNADELTPVVLFADPTTHRLLVNATITGSSGDGALLDGVSSSIKATVKDLTNSNPLATQIMDANGDAITSFGGGTQYTEGDTDASITGTALLWEDGSDTLRVASAAKPFPVEIIAGAGSGGTAAADDADFTAGTTSGTPAMGVYESSPTNVTDGDLGTVGITQARRLKTSATIDAALPAGTNAIGKLAANDGVDIGDVTTTNFPATVDTNSGNKSGSTIRVVLATDQPALTNKLLVTPDLPSGASTSAKQDTQITAEQAIQTSVELIDDAIKTDDAAFTPATTKVMMAGFEYDDTATDSVDEGDAGAARMSSRREVYTQIRDAAGNERGANVNASGQLAIAGPVTNAGTFAVQAAQSGTWNITDISGTISLPTGAATSAKQDTQTTSLQLIDDVIYVDDADWTDDTSKHALVGGVYQATPHTVTDGDVTPFLTDSNGRMVVSVNGTLTVGSHAVTNAGTFAVQDATAQASLSVIDDWDESDRAKVNPIVGQAGVQGGSGTVSNTTQRVVLATDVALPTGSNTIGAVTNTALSDFGAGEYETVAASQTAQALGATGAAGDYIAGILVIPATTSPGNVLLLDNATSITVFTGGASSVSNLVPFFIPLGIKSVNGAWKITTGANVSCIGVGNFT